MRLGAGYQVVFSISIFFLVLAVVVVASTYRNPNQDARYESTKLQGRCTRDWRCSGVGRDCGKTVAEGADVFVNDIDAAAIANVAQELGATALPGRTDATLPDRLMAQIL